MYCKPAGSLEGSPLGREAQDLLRRCVHCGFCLPACPTYRVLGTELDSPRGRIYLIKQIVEGAEVGETTREHLDRCLTCRSCETACPSGVQYGRIVDLGRALIEERAPRPARERFLRFALAEGIGRRGVFTSALRLGQALRPMLPDSVASRVPGRTAAATSWPEARHARRMVVLDGCVQPALAPGINAAAARVLDRLGVSLVRLRGETCCGALNHHLGRTEQALAQARRNVDACLDALDSGAEAIVSTASGCGVMVKDYAHLLRNDPAYAERALRASRATRDLSEVVTVDALDAAGLGRRGEAARVAFQSPCTLQHGQGLAGRVEALLESLGLALTPVGQPQLCCGSAGTYSILQPEIAAELRTRKLGTLQAGSPDVIATANIGCQSHLAPEASVPVRHWIELVDERLT